MGFLLGLIAGLVLGAVVGRHIARQKRLRQVGAALHEGRVSVRDDKGGPLEAEDFALILDDEFRDV